MSLTRCVCHLNSKFFILERLEQLIDTTKLMRNKESEEGATVSGSDLVTVFYYTYMIKIIIINRNVCLLCRTHSPETCLSNDFPSVKAMLVTSMEKNCNSPGQCKCSSLKFPFFFPRSWTIIQHWCSRVSP